MSDFKFANRTNWVLNNNPLSLALDRLKEQHIEILDLTQSNPTECQFKYPDDLISALNKPENLSYAPLAKGHVSARTNVVDYYKQKGYTLNSENVFLTSSTSEGYSFLLKLLTNPGDHVLIPKPSYPLFQFLLELHDVSFDYYPLVYEGSWRIDREAFEGLITSKTRAIILVNPNNPTGSFISSADLAFLNRLCLTHGMAIISDEVFLDYKHGASATAQSLVTNDQVPSFVLSGISKILALPQMKLSWMTVNGPADFVGKAIERLEIIADTYLSVNTPVQHALGSWLRHSGNIQEQILERVKHNLSFLKTQPLELLTIEGGWYAIIHEPAIDDEEKFILKLLQEEHILVHPGFFFDFEQEGYLIVSLLPSHEAFQKGINKISKLLTKMH